MNYKKIRYSVTIATNSVILMNSNCGIVLFFCYCRLPIASGCVPWCCPCGWTGSALSRAAVSVTKWSDPVRISCRPRRRAPVASTLENLHFFASVTSSYLSPLSFNIRKTVNRRYLIHRNQFNLLLSP